MSHSLIASLVAPRVIINLFAMVAILTGLLHVLGGYRIRQDHGRRWSWGSFFLGVVQIVLGALLLASPEEVPPAVLYVAIIWALIGGIGLPADAYRWRRLAVAPRRKDID